MKNTSNQMKGYVTIKTEVYKDKTLIGTSTHQVPVKEVDHGCVRAFDALAEAVQQLKTRYKIEPYLK